MLARLKSLELQGYKTFANRTLFEFAEAITAIVGPNGSGKSNVADSLRWVLGEQSYSLLRGKKTEDMIFSGSELRPRSGMAVATITFDNSDSWLPIDFSEVAITRRAYRDGDNEYLLNGQRVRLKDISELLAQSGLAERTYTIIGQGLVDAALALKAEDRRKLFEEAAGIGLYRVRREEALRRLDTTQHNLERVEDILGELEPRLRSLERQAKRAQEYEQVKKDLQVLLREWYGYHWHHVQQELMEAREAERIQTLALNRERSEQLALDTQLTQLRQQFQSSRQQLNVLLRQSAELYAQRETLNRDLAVSEERIRSIKQQGHTVEDEIGRLKDELELQTDLLRSVEGEVLRLEEDLREAHNQSEKANQSLAARLEERRVVDVQIQETRQELGGLNSKQGQLQARVVERTAQIERDRKSFDSVQQALERVEQEQKNAQNQFQIIQGNLDDAKQNQHQVEIALQKGQMQHAAVETERRQVLDDLSKQEAELERLNARIEVLNQAEADLSGYAQGTRRLLQYIRQDKLRGKPGALNQFLEVSRELEQAISAALGEFLESILLDSDLEDAFNLLEEGAGRGSLLPLSQLKPIQPLRPENFGMAEIVNDENGWIGVASDLVQTTAELRRTVDLLLGSVWIVRDRQVSRAILNSVTWSDRVGPALARLRIVTLKGEVFYVDGPAITGDSSDGEHGHTLLSRQRQRKELDEQRLTALNELEILRQKLTSLDNEITVLKSEVDRLTQEQRIARQRREQTELAVQQAQLTIDQTFRQAQWQQVQTQNLHDQIAQSETESENLLNELSEVAVRIQQVRESLRAQNNLLAGLVLDEFQTQAAHWNMRIAVTERALGDERRRIGERREVLDKTESRLSMMQTRLNEMAKGRETLSSEQSARQEELMKINESIATLEQLIKPGEEEIAILEEKRSQMEQSEATVRQAVSLADHRQAQTHLTLVRRQEALQSLQRRIEEDFGLVAFDYAAQVTGQSPLPLEGMVEQLPRVVQLAPEIEEGIKRQRAQLRRIGPINPEAQEEYKSVLDRYNFMTEQIADLRRAEVDIREVVQELDGLMEREFNKTFEAVATEFKAIFQRLFGGGMARLVLTDPDNLADTGIDIEARLPGRRTQGLSLLSGGERSLTATSLVFALLKVSPTPFCVLDEVDAMLDEANVGRFRDLLRELSQRTQFIIVTHNRNTVQAADVIYGVTMGRDSASQVVSLRMDQVAQVFE